MDRTVQALGDPSQLANRGCTMADRRRANGFFARMDSIQPIALVVDRPIELHIRWTQRATDQISRCAFDLFPSAHADFALGADETNHVSLAVRMVTNDSDAVIVFIRCILLPIVSLRSKFNRARIIAPECPLSDIEMVRTPVAVFTGTVFPEAAPTATVTTLHTRCGVRLVRCRPQPLVVIKTFGNRLFRTQHSWREAP